jgi:hypothetical protein
MARKDRRVTALIEMPPWVGWLLVVDPNGFIEIRNADGELVRGVHLGDILQGKAGTL